MAPDRDELGALERRLGLEPRRRRAADSTGCPRPSPPSRAAPPSSCRGSARPVFSGAPD